MTARGVGVKYSSNSTKPNVREDKSIPEEVGKSFGPENHIRYGVNVAVFSASADQASLTLLPFKEDSDE